MTAFTFRMGAGFAGEVNRTHPASISAEQNDTTNPILAAGLACMATATGTVRSVIASDTANGDLWGVLVRAFPTQQISNANAYAAAGYGAIAPGTVQPVDILRSGFIMVPVNGTVVKGGAVYVWSAASSGAHVQGGFEATTPGGSGFQITVGRAYWNSPADANGIAELAFNV